MHTVKIAIVGPGPAGPLTFDEVAEWARERLPCIPAMRWRVLKIPLGLGRPVFLDAGRFDVDRHLRREPLSAPGDDAQLDEVVSAMASTQLPRDRPLWELTVVEGLSAGRTALAFKLHHSIMDGQASVRFLEQAFDGGDLSAYGPVPDEPEPLPSRAELVRFALRSQARLWSQLAGVSRRAGASIRAT